MVVHLLHSAGCLLGGGEVDETIVPGTSVGTVRDIVLWKECVTWLIITKLQNVTIPISRNIHDAEVNTALVCGFICGFTHANCKPLADGIYPYNV